ncbi:MAG: response regulator transcription factor [Sandaracinaceae bacterium]|nr:response regulator transcription factor [Sandaracinaceae bacterium]
MPTRVLVLEDDDALRDELVAILDAEPDFIVAGAFGTGADALAFDGPADLFLCDLGLPDTTGMDVIRALRQRRPELEVMAHTVFDDRASVFEAIVAGASGYVLKGGGGASLLEALRELLAGGAPMSPRVARFVVAAFREQGTVAEQYTLTPREAEVLRGLEDGYSYKEIASRLFVSRSTVHTHIKRIYEKLHAGGRAEALTKAKLRGLLE